MCLQWKYHLYQQKLDVYAINHSINESMFKYLQCKTIKQQELNDILKSTFQFFQDYQQLAQESPSFNRRRRILNIHDHILYSK